MPCFVFVPGRVETLEQVLHLHRSFLATVLKSVQRRIDGADHSLGLPHTFDQAFSLVEQGSLPVKARVIQRSADFFERKTEFSADEDLLQPKQVSVGVKAVPGSCPGLGHEKPDGIVMMQRADGNAGQLSHIFDLIRARSSHEKSVRPDATRGSRGIFMAPWSTAPRCR